MTYQFERHFTLQEANALLPAVREAFQHIHVLVKTKGPGPGEPEPLGPPEDHNGASNENGHTEGGNGNGHANGKAHVTHKTEASVLSFQERATTVKEMLVSLQRFGIVVQDVMRGLIDFPCLYLGREVFLCYELSDGDTIQFYHEIEAGYAGRYPITSDFLASS